MRNPQFYASGKRPMMMSLNVRRYLHHWLWDKSIRHQWTPHYSCLIMQRFDLFSFEKDVVQIIKSPETPIKLGWFHCIEFYLSSRCVQFIQFEDFYKSLNHILINMLKSKQSLQEGNWNANGNYSLLFISHHQDSLCFKLSMALYLVKEVNWYFIVPLPPANRTRKVD